MSLLHTVKMTGTAKGVPLFVEVPVHPETSPYLVTSNKGMLWVDTSFNGGFVRSAVIRSPWSAVAGDTSAEVVRAIRQRGIELSWGNAFPFTDTGLRRARDYLSTYDLNGCDLLHRPAAPWVPEGCAVLVPKDRSYLGIVGTVGESSYTVVVHNPSRGMAVLGAW